MEAGSISAELINFYLIKVNWIHVVFRMMDIFIVTCSDLDGSCS